MIKLPLYTRLLTFGNIQFLNIRHITLSLNKITYFKNIPFLNLHVYNSLSKPLLLWKYSIPQYNKTTYFGNIPFSDIRDMTPSLNHHSTFFTI